MSFSVLMSVYKKEKPEYLRNSLESVFHQTLSCGELIIIQDGILTEELYQVIEEYKKEYPNIRTFQFEQNVQLGRALAKGVEMCRYDIIARMDSDDIAVLDRFRKQYGYLEAHPEISAVGGEIEEFNDVNGDGNIKKMPENTEEIKKYGKYRNPLNHMTVMFRKKDVLAVGNYMHFPYLEDYHLWSRMLAKGYSLYNIPEVMVRARISADLYKRRGGFRYFRTYMKLRSIQKDLGLLDRGGYIVGTVCSFGMTMQPSWLRKFMYCQVLRRKPK